MALEGCICLISCSDRAGGGGEGELHQKLSSCLEARTKWLLRTLACCCLVKTCARVAIKVSFYNTNNSLGRNSKLCCRGRGGVWPNDTEGGGGGSAPPGPLLGLELFQRSSGFTCLLLHPPRYIVRLCLRSRRYRRATVSVSGVLVSDWRAP